MKRTFIMISLLFAILLVFTACKNNKEDIVNTTDTLVITDEKEPSNTTEETTTEATVKAPENNISSTTNQNNRETTQKADSDKDEATKASITTTTPVTDYIKIEDNKVETPAYELEIPDDFEVKSDDEGLLLENKKGTIQFNIMDKTDVATDFEAYVSKTHSTMVAVGATSDEIQDVVINDFNMKRFSMTITEEEDVLDAYCYLTQIDGRTLVITLTSKDGGLEDVSEADAFVAEIKF